MLSLKPSTSIVQGSGFGAGGDGGKRGSVFTSGVVGMGWGAEGRVEGVTRL